MAYDFANGAGAAAGLIEPSDQTRNPAGSRKPAPSAAETESLTDLGNARRLVRMFGSDLRWVPKWKCWMRWQGTHWAQVSDEEVQRLAHEVSENLRAEAQVAKNSAARKALRDHARKAESGKDIAAMVKEARALLAMAPEQFDEDGYLYNVENGTLDFRAKDVSAVFRPHRREDFITKMVPVAWHPAAVCPRFDRFVLQIFAGHQETADFVLRTMATALVRVQVEQSYHLWFGRRGRNGKGALQRVLNSLTDPYRVTVDPRLFFASYKYDPNAPSSAVMALRGARLVIGSEMSKDDIVGGAFLKRYTGGDDIAGRDLNEKQRETKTFPPTGTVIISTNFFPQADPTDDALWARTRIVEFPVTFGAEGGPPMDATLEEDMQKELPGILVRLVQAWMEIQQADRTRISVTRGLLNAPDAVLETTKMVRSTFGPIGLFLHEMCVVGEKERARPRDLYTAYVRWAQAQGKEGDEVLTETKFGMELGILRYTRKSSNGVDYRVGLRLKTEEELRPPPAQVEITMNYRENKPAHPVTRRSPRRRPWGFFLPSTPL